MKTKFIQIVFSLFLLIFLSQVFAQERNTLKPNYRRTDFNNPPPTSYTQLPKEQIFPLGWNTGSLNKINSGTGTWTELNPLVPRVDYYGIDFINPDTGWACGGSGAIIKTTNGGDDWTIAETPVTNLLLKIHSYNGQIVICTGYDGLILRSGDGGETFEQVTSGVGSGTDLWGVQMLNDTLGWVCGLNQTLLKTTDAGLSWQMITPGLDEHYWSLDFQNEQYGMIACGGGKVLRTTNGGQSWAIKLLEYTENIYTIDVIDSLHIAAGGLAGRNYYSSDGGENWITKQRLTDDLNWIEFINADTGYCLLDVLGLRKTTNRGDTWISPLITDIGAWQLEMLSEEVGYSVGEELQISKTENGDENRSNVILNYNWSDVFFINESYGYFLSASAPLYKTEDGGISYQRTNSPGGSDLLFIDSLTGYIGSGFSIYKTTDGAGVWYSVNIEDTTGIIDKIFFINRTTGWAVAGWSSQSHAKILKTTDGGENWYTQIELVGSDGFTSIYFVDTLNGWATSRYIWQTTDGGANWVERTDIPAILSTDIYFLNSDSGWTIDNYSFARLIKTSDGGLNWIEIPEINDPFDFYFFPDPIHWIITGVGIGGGGYIVYYTYITNDYGNSWMDISADVPTGFNEFQAPNNTVGYAVGSSGLILRYDDTTFVPVELLSFEGIAENNEVVLVWQTASELNNQGFYIEKSYDKINWETIGFVPGRGTTTSKSNYTFYDSDLIGNHLFYKLKQIDFDGSYSFSEIIEVEIQINNYSLSQNYPNPFNLTTTIKYDLPEAGKVSLKIFDILGSEVAALVDETKPAGRYEAVFNANHLASGVYIYTLNTNDYTASKKLILLK